MVVLNFEPAGCETPEEESNQAATDEEMELTNSKKAMRSLKEWTSTDALLMHSAVKYRNHAQDD